MTTKRKNGEPPLYMLPPTPPTTIGPSMIEEKVCTLFKISPAIVLSQSRQLNHAWPRQLIQFLAYNLSGLSYSQVGRHYAKDHGTIMNSCKSVQNAMDVYPEIKSLVDRIIADLKATK